MAPIYLEPLLVPRITQLEMGKAAIPLLDAWIYFNLISNTVLLPILVLTFLLSKRVRRHPTLVNLCITWIFSGVFSCLLFYAGQDRAPKPVDKSLCIVQTSLLYGITPMWSVAILMMMYYVAMALDGRVLGKWEQFSMLVAPYIAQCSFTIATFFVSINNPNKVTRRRRFFYCALQYSPLSSAMSLFTSAICVGIVILMLYLAVMAYRIYRGIRNAGRPTGIDLRFVIRVVAFAVYVTLGMAVNILTIFDEDTVVPDLYAATMGTAIFFIFATQQDVLRVWCFWMRDKPPKPEPIYISREPNYGGFIDLAKSAPPADGEKKFDIPPIPPPKDVWALGGKVLKLVVEK